MVIVLQLVGHLDQVSIRIPEVDGQDRPRRARALHRSLHDGHPGGLEMGHHVRKRHRRQEAQIGRARRRPRRLGFKLAALLVQVDLLAAKLERLAASVVSAARQSQAPQPAEKVETRFVGNGAAGRRVRGDEVDDAFDDRRGLYAPFHGRGLA